MSDRRPLPTRKIPRQATSAVAHIAPPPDDDDPLLGFAPYLHAAPRRNSITPELQRRFVATLAATGIVKQAAKSIGKSLEALYKLRHKSGAQGFAAAWDAALERGVQRLEDCALERAIQGVSTPIVSQGEILGWWDKPDNTLLRFLLQHRLPARYGVQDLRPGHPVYDSICAEVLARERAEVRARAEAEEARLRARRAELGALHGFDPDEEEDEDVATGAAVDIMTLDDEAFLAAYEREQAEARERYERGSGGADAGAGSSGGTSGTR